MQGPRRASKAARRQALGAGPWGRYPPGMTRPTRIGAAVIALAARDDAPVRRALAAARPDLALLSAGDPVPHPDATALVAFAPPDAPGRYAGVPWVHCAGAGADKLLEGLGFRPPLMTRTVGAMGAQAGEYVASYLLADLQGHPRRQARQAEARWDKEGCLPSHAFGQRALVLGTGGIGGGVARTLAGLGVAVDGASRSGAPAAPFAETFAADALPEDLSGYGLLVSALPGTPATRGLVGGALLSRLSRALLVSVGRGAAVDHEAVLAAIGGGRLRGAVLDVFEDEPLPPASPLWRARGVTVTPHVSGVTRPEDIADAFLGALRALERGEAPPLIVDQDRGY